MTFLIVFITVIFLLFGLIVFRGAPYVPSQRRFILRAFEDLYPLGPDDVLIDVGSGDGKVLRLAAQKGARAIGYELNPLLVVISQLLSFANSKIEIYFADFWRTSFPTETTVVYLFIVTRDSKKMARKLQRETNRIGHPLHVMTYGSGLKGLIPRATLDAYQLYTLQPVSTHV